MSGHCSKRPAAYFADNDPDQGQPLAAAGDWRTDGTQRELEMLIEVRGAVSRRFSAPQGPIRFSPVQPPLLFLVNERRSQFGSCAAFSDGARGARAEPRGISGAECMRGAARG